MTYVTEDIVTDILLRLSVKCLLKCLCVCKNWYTLIKSPHFVDLHLKSDKNNRDYLIFSGKSIDTKTPKKALWYYVVDNISGALLQMPSLSGFPGANFPPGRLMVCEPCNGIFCVLAKDISPANEAFFLCNPATRESIRLPNRPLGDPPLHKPLCVGTSACGLGFDPCTKDYKVVSVLTYGSAGSYGLVNVVYRIWIYNFNSNSWRQVQAVLPSSMRMTEGLEICKNSWHGSGLVFNGRLHWSLRDLDLIVWFDITNEVMGHIPLPPNVVPGDMIMHRNNVVLLEDCLTLVVIAMPKHQSHYAQNCSIFIWTMTNELWVKRCSFSIPFPGVDLHPISFRKDEVLLLVETRKNALVSVSLIKPDNWRVKTQNLDDRVKTQNRESEIDIVLYKESLVSLR